MLNKAILIGRLGADPETRYTPSGSQVVTCSVATTRRWKDKQSGERVEETEWHRVIVWNKLAEICSKYLSKGSQVYFEGRLKTRKWQDNQAVNHYTTEIIAEEMKMLDSKPSDTATQAHTTTQPSPAQESYDDDIPY